VAALLRDRETQGGRFESFYHLQEALKLLQTRISSHDVDESVAVSSFLLSYLSFVYGDLDDARTHLKGMLLVFDFLEPGTSLRDEFAPSPLIISPLTALIWRMAIRLDFISSIASGKAPVLPRFVHHCLL
jgi:Fungal specific transcription factor domain